MSSPISEPESPPNGPAWAALPSASIGCAGFAFATDLSECFPRVSQALQWYHPPGHSPGWRFAELQSGWERGPFFMPAGSPAVFAMSALFWRQYPLSFLRPSSPRFRRSMECLPVGSDYESAISRSRPMNLSPMVPACRGEIIPDRYVSPSDSESPSVVVVNTTGVIGPVGAALT